MMRPLFQRLYEPQKEWFCKKGVSLHGAFFIFCNDGDSPLLTFFASSIKQSTLNFKSYTLRLTAQQFGQTMVLTTNTHHLFSGLVVFIRKLE